ncbi:MAG: type IV pilus secretin PilQ [Sulfuricella sp.]|nr:type IV pilus secretin PilQ [Sulfuricella sp.]
MNMIKSTIHCFLQAACLIALFLANGHAAVEPNGANPEAPQTPQNSIESVDYSALQGGKFLITLKLKHALKNPPAGFTVNNPPRIALDLPDTANALGKNSIDVGEGVLRNLNIVQAGSRTRLVINLAKPAGYETRIAGNTLLITLQGTEATGVTSNMSAKFAEALPGAQKHALRDIDFRRGKGGEGRVVVDLSDTNTGIDIRTEGKTIIVEFINATLPRNLERKLDVVDFGTPVQTVSTFGHGNNARIVIEPKGLWEHSAYQTDRQFILDIKPIVEDPSKLVQGTKTGYIGEKLSLDFQNIETRTLLAVLADFAEMNVVISDSVRSSTTLRLKDVPWDQALDITLKQSGLSMRTSGNVIMIAPSEELTTKERLELEAKQQISEVEPLRTESFQIKYQKAADIQKDLQKILSKRGSVVFDAHTNILFVQDTPSILEEIRKRINQIDVPVRQVMIESRIVEASDTFSRNLGVRLGFHDGGAIAGTNQRAKIGGNLSDTGFHTGQTATVPDFLRDSMNVNMPVVGAAGVISAVLFQANATRFLNLELSALQADGKGKIISNPRVLTADKKEATIESGTEIPYQQASSSGATTTAFKKAVLSLKVTPQIRPNDNIVMDIKVNKDSALPASAATGNIPPISTKQISTIVEVENGGTVVIGGIYQQTQDDTVTKVPLLGDVPVLGFLFRSKGIRDDKSELLIFVTPRILKESLNLR